jgi:hypothetical protein
LRRKAYNAAFDAFGCTINGQKLVWSTEYYVGPLGWCCPARAHLPLCGSNARVA